MLLCRLGRPRHVVRSGVRGWVSLGFCGAGDQGLGDQGGLAACGTCVYVTVGHVVPLGPW